MVHAAYEPFSLNSTSDHCGIILDFDTKILLGRRDTIAPVIHRGLNANNPVQTEKFLKYLQHFWRQLDIPKHINDTQQLQDKRTLQNTINDIDKDITRAMIRAEQKVRRKDKPPWSPELKQASLIVKFYKLVRQETILCTNLTAAIDQKAS